MPHFYYFILYFTSSKITYTENQLVMYSMVQIWAFYSSTF